MGLVLPAELKWLEWIVGSDWPEGDETAMRRCAEAWVGAGADVKDLIEDLQATASRVLGTVEGEGAEAFRAYFETYIKTDPQYLPKLAQACEQLAAALNGGATEIEYAKYMFIALLIITAIEITSLIATAVATFGASTAAIPAVEAAAQVTSRSIAQQLLIAIGKGALRGLLENVLLDLGIQALQVAQGNRDGIDLSKTGAAALDGAIGGAISGGVGFGMGKVPGLDGAGGTALSGMLRGGAREGIAEGISGVAGTAASAMVHGESLSAEDLAKGATSGAFGGAVGGAKSGLDGLSTPDVDVPHFGGDPDGGVPPGDPASADGGGSAPDHGDADLSAGGASDVPHTAGGGSGESTHSSHSVDSGPARTADHGTSYQSYQGSSSSDGVTYGGSDHTGTAHHGTSLAGAGTAHPAPVSDTPHTSYAGGTPSSSTGGPAFTPDGRTGASAGSFLGGPAPDGSSPSSSSGAASSAVPSSPAPSAAAPSTATPGTQSPSATSSGGGTTRGGDDAPRSSTPVGAALSGFPARSNEPSRDDGSASANSGPPLSDEVFESRPAAAEQDAQAWADAGDGGVDVVPVVMMHGSTQHAAAIAHAATGPDGTGRPEGTGPHDPAGHPMGQSPVPENLPPHLHEVYRSSEQTPAGRSFFTPDEQNMRDLAQRVPADPDRYVVDGHGGPDGIRVGERSLTAGDVADLIRSDPNWTGREVMLISCETGDGPDSFATQLSRELGVPVTAPDGLAWTDDRGRVFSSFGSYDTEGTRTATWPPDGGWSVHNPNGTIAGTGQGGFPPGHPGDLDTRPEGAQARGGESDTPLTPQEERLRSPERDDFRQNPQQQVSPFQVPDVPPERTHQAQVRPGEPFLGSRPLEPNSRYDVTDGRPGTDGRPQRRSIIYTGPDGRVTHVDGQVSNLRRDHPDHVANPDVQRPLPDVRYRVEVGGHVQTYATGADGAPQRGAIFDPPAHQGEVQVGPGHDTGITPPDPHRPFDPGEPLQPYTRYEVTDASGNRRGTYYTDGEGAVHWVETESGRSSRVNPELRNLDPSVHYRTSQTFDPDRPPPHSDAFSPRADATRIRVHPDQAVPAGGAHQGPPKGNEVFARRPGLEPNARYEVYSSQGEPRGIFYTDDHGKVRLVDTFQPFNPDLNNPRPNTHYSVDDGKFVFETGPQNEHAGSGRQRPENVTDSAVATSNGLEKDEPSGDLSRRDNSAQRQSGGLGGREEVVRPDGATGRQNVNDGGHMAGHQYGGPGELVNMISQLRAQNQGNNDAALGLLSADTWHAMEGELAAVGAREGRAIDQFNVFALRDPGTQVPHTVQVRWVETVDGKPTVHMRSFSNVPAR